MPDEKEFSAYCGRCVLIKRPAFNRIQLCPEIYHNHGKINCDKTKKAHDGYVLEGVSTDHVHHLLIFPDGMELEPAHFAGEATNKIEPKQNPITLPGNHELNPFGKDVRMLYVYFEVAFKGGGTKLMPKKKDVTTAKDLFS